MQARKFSNEESAGIVKETSEELLGNPTPKFEMLKC
jgi:hypothetical protein